MSDSEDKSSKTEPPTRRRLRDARLKEGNINKSKDLTSTAGVIGWTVTGFTASGWVAGLVSEQFDVVFQSLQRPFEDAIGTVGVSLARTFVITTLVLFGLGAVLPVFAEFMQVGVLFVTKRITPDLNRLNPAEGLKKLFSQENLVEVVRSLIKTTVIGAIAWVVIQHWIADVVMLPHGRPEVVAQVYGKLILQLLACVAAIFALISLLDALYQRFAYLKRLRMSRREIKREMKDDEGDPHIKARRKQLHQEWASRNAVAGVRNANALVTNPTHIAIGLRYAPPEIPVPLICAMGEGELAQRMKREAVELEIPVIENIVVARGLYTEAEIDDFIPEAYYRPVAEILLWAQRMRDALANYRAAQSASAAGSNNVSP